MTQWIPTFGVHAWVALSFEERMRAAMGATGKCSVGPHTLGACLWILINFYQWHQALWWLVLILSPQMIITFINQQYWVKWYTVIQVISSHCINPSLKNSVQQINCEIIWNSCAIRLLYHSTAYNSLHIIWSAILCRLSKCYSIPSKGFSLHSTNDPSRMIEIIGFWNDAFYEPTPGHQLNILRQNAVSDLYIYLIINEILSPWTRCGPFHTTITGGLLVKWGILPSDCISQFPIMEIIYKYCKPRIKILLIHSSKTSDLNT